MPNDFIVRLITLPPTVKGFVSIDADGFYSIYINDSLSAEEQKETFDHEMGHIVCDHFYSRKPIEIIESEAENYAKSQRS